MIDRLIRSGLMRHPSRDIRGPLRNATVVEATEVADFWYSEEAANTAFSNLPVIAPPWPNFFVEWKAPRSVRKVEGNPISVADSAKALGVHFLAVDLLSGEDQHLKAEILKAYRFEERFGESKWLVISVLYAETIGGRFVELIVQCCAVSETGKLSSLTPEGDIGVAFLPGLDTAEGFDEDDVAVWRQEFKPAFLTIGMLHCKNVDIPLIDPPVKVSKKHEKKYGVPLSRYHVLKIGGLRKVSQTEAEKGNGIEKALHISRGHFKTYTASNPLFGKYTGTYWWPQQLRGNPAKGKVEKDYAVAKGESRCAKSS